MASKQNTLEASYQALYIHMYKVSTEVETLGFRHSVWDLGDQA